MPDWHLRNWAKLYSGTPAERALEPAVAALGVPYRFQHPIWALGLFPDFALPKHKVVLEVDDAGHKKPAQRRADAARTAKLAKAGWRVVRCTNDEAETAPFETVARMMREAGLPDLAAKVEKHAK